jgi:hypothetical protein
MLQDLLTYNPARRIDTVAAMAHPYFQVRVPSNSSIHVLLIAEEPSWQGAVLLHPRPPLLPPRGRRWRSWTNWAVVATARSAVHAADTSSSPCLTAGLLAWACMPHPRTITTRRKGAPAGQERGPHAHVPQPAHQAGLRTPKGPDAQEHKSSSSSSSSWQGGRVLTTLGGHTRTHAHTTRTHKSSTQQKRARKELEEGEARATRWCTFYQLTDMEGSLLAVVLVNKFGKC